MKLTTGPVAGVISLAAAMGVRSWMSTLRYQLSYYDASVDPISPAHRTPCIYIFWHEYIVFMFYLRGHCDVAMLLSQHRDAEVLARATRYMGFGAIRGSSSRGGISALRTMYRGGQSTSLTITPDGPRGPRRVLAPGCVYLASRLQLPIVPMGLGYDRPWRVESAWDKFAVPRPGSRARGVIGPPIYVPPDADRHMMEQYRVHVESMLNQLTGCAEDWASSGVPIGEPVVCRRQARAPSWLKPRDPKGAEMLTGADESSSAKVRLSA